MHHLKPEAPVQRHIVRVMGIQIGRQSFPIQPVQRWLQQPCGQPLALLL